MSDRAELLLGGWLAGTLTPAERRELLNAAMANQMLFDALADEEGLRELLADPAVRRELVALLGPVPRQAARTSWWDWFRQPAPLAAAGAAALAVVGFLALRPGLERRSTEAMQAPPAAKMSAPAEAAGEAAPAAPPANAEPPRRTLRRAAGPPRQEETPTALPAAQPPPVAAAAPATPPPPPPRPVVAAADNEVKKAKEETAAAAAESVTVTADLAQPAAPVSYRLERQAASGAPWTPVPNAATFPAGDRVRLAITAGQPGNIQIKAGAEELTLRAAAGEVIHYPPAGALPADPGERAISVSFQSAGPRPLADRQSLPGGLMGSQRARVPAAATPPQFSVTVRLVFR